MMHFAVEAISLESSCIGGGAEALHLPCETVSVAGGMILVGGLRAGDLRHLPWTPDYLSFEAGSERHRYPVARPAITGPLAARFAIL